MRFVSPPCFPTILWQYEIGFFLKVPFLASTISVLIYVFTFRFSQYNYSDLFLYHSFQHLSFGIVSIRWCCKIICSSIYCILLILNLYKNSECFFFFLNDFSCFVFWKLLIRIVLRKWNDQIRTCRLASILEVFAFFLVS